MLERLNPTALALLGLLLLSIAAPRPAQAQSMDLALNRLSVSASDEPGSTCPTTFAGGLVRRFCEDNEAWARLTTQFASSLIPPLLTPGRTGGMRGFYIGLETSIANIDGGAEYWSRGTRGDDPTVGINRFVDGALAWSRLQIRKGLPFGFELGTSISTLVNTSYWTLGAEVRWALFEGFRYDYGWIPDVTVRAAVQTLLGESEMNMTIAALDLTLSKPIVIANVFELSPFLAGQLAWVFTDSELVDLTPDASAFDSCDPDPNTPGDGAGAPPYCRAGGADFNNNAVFQQIRSMRWRGILGVRARWRWITLSGAFSGDLISPSEADPNLPPDLPQQWRLDIGLGLTY